MFKHIISIFTSWRRLCWIYLFSYFCLCLGFEALAHWFICILIRYISLWSVGFICNSVSLLYLSVLRSLVLWAGSLFLHFPTPANQHTSNSPAFLCHFTVQLSEGTTLAAFNASPSGFGNLILVTAPGSANPGSFPASPNVRGFLPHIVQRVSIIMIMGNGLFIHQLPKAHATFYSHCLLIFTF